MRASVLDGCEASGKDGVAWPPHVTVARGWRSMTSISDLKAHQAAKVREIGEALVAVGYHKLDDQAAALGLSRSTTGRSSRVFTKAPVSPPQHSIGCFPLRISTPSYAEKSSNMSRIGVTDVTAVHEIADEDSINDLAVVRQNH